MSAELAVRNARTFSSMGTAMGALDGERCKCKECVEQLKVAVAITADIDAMMNSEAEAVLRARKQLSDELSALQQSAKTLTKQCSKAQWAVVKAEGVLTAERRKKERLAHDVRLRDGAPR